MIKEEFIEWPWNVTCFYCGDHGREITIKFGVDGEICTHCEKGKNVTATIKLEKLLTGEEDEQPKLIWYSTPMGDTHLAFVWEPVDV